MDSLEDLVTSTLAPQEDLDKEFAPLPPLQVLSDRERASSQEIRAMCQNIPLSIKKDPSSAPYLLAQLLAYLNSTILPGRQKNRALWVFSLAATYAQNKDPEVYKSICHWTASLDRDFQEREYRSMEKIALANTTSRLDFLAEFFEEDLIKELVYITGVQRATARRWIQGAGVSWTNSQQIYMLSRIFYALRHKQNLEKAEALLFYTSSWQDSQQSPREMMQSYTYFAGPQTGKMLQSIGIRE